MNAVHVATIFVAFYYLRLNFQYFEFKVPNYGRTFKITQIGIPLWVQNSICVFLVSFGHYFLAQKTTELL